MTLGSIGVTPVGRAGLEYRDGDRRMTIDGELQFGKFDYTVFSTSIGIWQDTGLAATEAERLQIIENIRNVFERSGLKVEFC